jgi:hypothetical protein
MVWVKGRPNAGYGHKLFDTERGVLEALTSNTTGAEASHTGSVTSFNTDGFSLGTDGNGETNYSGSTYASWTFRKAPRFFDVVTYTGNGVAGREIAHNLGVAPGMIFIKKTSSAEGWRVFHKDLANTEYLRLDSTDAKGTGSNHWNSTTPTSSVFTLGSDSQVNDGSGSGETYVAYLFAHDPNGEDDDGMIACGSYSGSSSDTVVDIGWEPQFLLVKPATDVTANWAMVDMMRGMPLSSYSNYLTANTSDAESTLSAPVFTANANGFTAHSGPGYITTHSAIGTYIYMAIRAPMMVEPESGSEVFTTSSLINNYGVTSNPNMIADHRVDVGIYRRDVNETGAWIEHEMHSRLTGDRDMDLINTSIEVDSGRVMRWDYNKGYLPTNYQSDRPYFRSWMFKRAKGFMDVVAYTGNGTAGRTVNHSLGVVPEMVIQKSRSVTSTPWNVWHNNLASSQPNQLLLSLNDSSSATTSNYMFYSGNGTISSTEFGGFGPYDGSNESGQDYILYLFATLAGVSKVGSFTGSAGASQDIDCGFSNGARFILIKRTNTTGHWFMWDTERGIVAGNDPHLELDTTTAESSSYDTIDPLSTGFTVNRNAGTDINVDGGTYIFLAIA